MAKTILGVDLGQDRLKLVLMNGARVKKAAVVQMPERLLRNGRIASVETLGELIRTTLKRERMSCSRAAVVLTGDNVFVRSVTMPQMTEKQLEYNLPFEFRDYISGELKGFVFDYAMLSTPEELRQQALPPAEDTDGAILDQGEPARTMDLLAAAVPAEQLEEYRQALRKAGLKMVKAAPAVCALGALLRAQPEGTQQEYCILDLGYSAIRMYMFRGERHIVTRVLEQGLSTLDAVLADIYHVDVHLAHTYLLANHEDCQNQESCIAAFNAIAVELMRAMNFYRFSNPDSEVSGIWLCGGGAQIAPLRDAIAEMLDIALYPASDLIPGGGDVEECTALVQAIGMAQS